MGAFLRKELGLRTIRQHIGSARPYVLVWDEDKILRLARAYGLEEEFEGGNLVTSVTSDTMEVKGKESPVSENTKIKFN